MAKKQFDPNKVSVSLTPIASAGLASITMRDFGADEYINLSFDEDKVTKHVGVDGGGAFIINRNKGGICTITLAMYSPSNDSIMDLDKTETPFALSITDKATTAGIFFADEARLQKIPDFTRAKEIQEIQYAFTFLSGTLYHSGVDTIS